MTNEGRSRKLMKNTQILHRASHLSPSGLRAFQCRAQSILDFFGGRKSVFFITRRGLATEPIYAYGADSVTLSKKLLYQIAPLFHHDRLILEPGRPTNFQSPADCLSAQISPRISLLRNRLRDSQICEKVSKGNIIQTIEKTRRHKASTSRLK